MITINLTGIYLFLCKLSATICITSAVTFGFIMFVDMNYVENDDSIVGFVAYIVASAFAASAAMLLILLLALVIYYIWKI